MSLPLLMLTVLFCPYLISVCISNSTKCKAAFPHKTEYIVPSYSHDKSEEIKVFVEISYSVTVNVVWIGDLCIVFIFLK